MLEIRQMAPKEKAEVVELSKNLKDNKFVKDFNSLWTRWKKWETDVPMVAVKDNEIIGFHAACYLKNDYVNSMYLVLKEECRGQGIGRQLYWATIQEGQLRGLTRLCAKASIKGDGYRFFMSMGMKPVARTGDEYSFDCEFDDSPTMDEFIARLRDGRAYTPPSKRRDKLYREKAEEIFY